MLLLVLSLLSTSCKKKTEVVCDITFDSPADAQCFNSGDTVRVNISYGTLGNFGDSITLFVNQTRQSFSIKQHGGNYEYDFIPVVADGIIDTINLEAVPGRASGAVCREDITIYVQP